MTDYTKTTDFTSKDSLPSGDSGKIIRGAEFGTEFDNIETAVNSKSNINNPSFTGNITVTGTVDGRDIAADGTKLDTIETSADVTDTANVTAAGAVMDSELTNEAAVKALNQGVATTDSPTFAAVTSTGNVTVGGTVDGRDVAADGTKLDTVETNADVTDTANVTAAGALMDSEVTNLDQVKAFDSADYATAAQGTTADNALPKTGGAMTGAITTNSTFDGRDVATDGTKLDGIEASADVTDTANVTAAGALMDSELTSEASVKALNQGVATTDSPTFAGVTANGTVEFDGLSGTGAVTVTDILDQDDMSGNSATALATQQSIKAYVDSQVGTVDTLAEVLSNGNATGGTDIAFGDGDKALFGAGSDLQIYHDGLHSYVSDVGTGHLRLTGTNVLVEDGAGTDYIYCASDVVNLYHGGNLKFKTTSTGIDITGSVVSDGLTVNTIAVAVSQEGGVLFGADNQYGMQLKQYSTSGGVPHASIVAPDDVNGHLSIEVGGSQNEAMRFAANGDISFYEDTGTTAKFFWDASAEKLELSNLKLYSDNVRNEGGILYIGTSGNNATQFYNNDANTLHISGAGNVGIGTSLPQKPLHINSGTGNIGVRVESSDATASIEFMDNGTTSTALSPRVGGISDDFFVQTNGTEAMRIDSSGNVGIGTSNPSSPLHISNSGNSVQLRMQRDASNYWGFQLTGGNLNFQDIGSSTTPLSIDSSGNVGIGTSSPAFAGSRTGINIKGTTANGVEAILLDNTDTGNAGFALVKDGVDAFIYNRTNGIIGFGTNNTEAMRIDSSGNVGIGTSSPDSLVHAYKANNAILKVAEADGYASLQQSGVNSYLNSVSSGGSLIFRNGTAPTERMRIDSSGNLIVSGTSSGDATSVALHNGGYVHAVTSHQMAGIFDRRDSDGDILIFRNGATNQVGSIASVGGADIKVVLSGDADQYITGNSAANYMSFSAANQERMRLDSSGNLLVGCTSGGAKVVTEAVPTGTAYLAKWSATGGSALYLEVGGSAVGTITCTASATAYNTSSDQRLKDNIVDAPSASDDIDAIQVRSFDWKADGSHQKYGMVAQELNTVAPEAVSTPEDSEEMMGVDYSKLVPMLVKEIQSLRARVAQLETN